ncbi:MAG: metalloenzyme [Myxococcaceae bacterium]|nr:MAG: metalloenzyme [Myxococcaceae bacterium]
MRVALLFIDGVGVGVRNPDFNPLARGGWLLSQFEDGSGTALPGGGLTLLETTFGVPGRPQSATNQTAILTGEPAPRLVGKHVLGYPDAALRQMLLRASVVKRLVAAGRRATFVNGYPGAYLTALGLPHAPAREPEVEIPARARRRLKPSSTTLAFAAAEVPLRTLDQVRAGEALTHDVTGARGRARGFDLPLRTADEAAEIFWRTAEGVDFTLFEHFLADEAGHAKDMPLAESALETFDAFARAVLYRRPADVRVLVCSDHGNVEDLRTRNHTLGPVALLSFPPLDGVSRPETVADVAGLIAGAAG